MDRDSCNAMTINALNSLSDNDLDILKFGSLTMLLGAWMMFVKWLFKKETKDGR